MQEDTDNTFEFTYFKKDTQPGEKPMVEVALTLDTNDRKKTLSIALDDQSISMKASVALMALEWLSRHRQQLEALRQQEWDAAAREELHEAYRIQQERRPRGTQY